MIALLLHLFRLLPVLGGSHRHLALETPPLRQRLAVYEGRSGGRTYIRAIGSFGFCLSRVRTECQGLMIVIPGHRPSSAPQRVLARD
jgi:hypothetical protein